MSKRVSTNFRSSSMVFIGLGLILSANFYFNSVAAAKTGGHHSQFTSAGLAAGAVVQFSSSNYFVGEGDTFVTITVNRTGDTTGTSSVQFQTGNNSYAPCNQLDGLARPNCKFIRNDGTLTFNPGDTSKTFTVLIIDDAYVNGNSHFPVDLGSPVNASLGSTTEAFVSIMDNDSSTISPAQLRFVGNFSGGLETPPNNSPASGMGAVLLNKTDQTQATAGLHFTGLSSSETSASLRGPGTAGISGPLLFTLPATNPVIDFQLNGLTTQQALDLKAGRDYLEVRSANFPSGEIRAQLQWNPTLEEDFFVLQQYFDFLQRLPDPGGFAYWRDKIKACGTDVQCLHDQTIGVSNAFFFELEYQQTGAYVYRLFRALFGNSQPVPNPDPSNPTEANKIPSYDAYSTVRALVVGGSDLTQGQLDAANLFLTAPQFLAVYPANLTIDQFVDAVLNRIKTDLGVDLGSQRSALIALGSRQQIIYRLANDDLAGGNGGINNRALIDAEYNREFVTTEYFGYLRRDGDIPGILFWLDQINKAPLRDVPKQNAMVCSFITSDEYQKRFGPNSPRSNLECPR